MAYKKSKPHFNLGDLVRAIGSKTVWRIKERIFDETQGQFEYFGDQIIGGQLHCAYESRLEYAPQADNVIVSDHALVRYFERVLDVDVDAIRSAIISERIEQAINRLGDGKYPVTTGFRAVVKNNVVVTITPVK